MLKIIIVLLTMAAFAAPAPTKSQKDKIMRQRWSQTRSDFLTEQKSSAVHLKKKDTKHRDDLAAAKAVAKAKLAAVKKQHRKK